jgi:fatty acid desaturase
MNAPRLTKDQLKSFGEEMDQIRHQVIAEIGEEDAEYIRKVLKAQRGLEVAGRALFYLPPAWPVAVAALSLSKILDNMEIGHNVMHGQYDWMGDPGINSRIFEWDNACPSEQWKYSHNYIHHTYTNILGKDRDIGYGILRMDEDQKWSPHHLANPVVAFGLMMLFEWGVSLHAGLLRKYRNQLLKDYLLFPALTGPLFPLTLAGNATANVIRNIWAFNIIFCGHFPAGVESFTEEECLDESGEESKGHWYYRQLLGSANLTGGPLFHVLTGNLSHQIEHHLFPDLPARRYPEIAEQVKEICTRYGLPYNTGPLHKQLGSVFVKIFKLAVPGKRKQPEMQDPVGEHTLAA